MKRHTKQSNSLLSCLVLFCFGMLGTSLSQAQANYTVNVVSCGADPAVNPVGSANQSKDDIAVRMALDLIEANGSGTLYFPPGVYELSIDPDSIVEPAAIYLRLLKNVTLLGAANGVSEIRFRNRNANGIYLQACTDIQIRNLNLLYEKPSHLEGLITSYSTNAIHPVKGVRAPSYTVRLNPEFHQYWNDEYLFSNTDTVRRIEAFDPVTRRRKPNTAALKSDYLAPTQWAHTIRVFPTSTTFYINTINSSIDFNKDWAVITTERVRNTTNPDITKQTVSARAIGAIASTRITVQDVQFFNSPFYAAFFNNCNTATFNRVSVLPDPNISAKGALVSVNRDALRFISTKGPLKITNCDIASAGDDSIAIFTEYHEVMQRDAANNRIYVEQVGFPGSPVNLKAGEYLQSYFPYHMSYTGGRSITAVADGNFPGSRGKWVTVSGSLPGIGQYVTVWQNQAPGFNISNNHIRGSRARGIFLRARNGTISNNNVADCANGGIIVGPDTDFYKEGNFVRDVNIDDNIAYNNSYGLQAKQSVNCQLGGLTVGLNHNNSIWPYYLGNYNVNIRNNSFAANQMNGLFLSNLSKATVDGNVFIANQLDPDSVAGTARGIPANSANGMMHLQGGWNISHGSNIVHRRNSSFPHRTISTANGSNGRRLPGGLNARSGSLADITDVAATSFELEEAWSKPVSYYTIPPAFSEVYRSRGRWMSYTEGLTLSYSNWGLWGNHHRFPFYRGCVSSFCNYPNGWLNVSNQNKPIKKVHFHAAANNSGANQTPWNLRVRSYSTVTRRWTWNSTVINSSSLPHPPNFQKYTFNLPAGSTRVQFYRQGGNTAPPYLFLDDVILEH